MSEKIIFVDDEPHILDSMKRQLRKRYNVVTAGGGKEALQKFESEGPFSVIISDMRMPEMNGIELLTAIRDRYPDTVRMMLTGNADQETATEAVNKGQIFRFLNKPCPVSVLVTALALALKQHRLISAEKQLLNQTLKGSVKVLSEVLSFSNPTVFSSSVRIQSIVVKIAEALSLHMTWKLEIAALLSQIGCITLPREIIDKVYSDLELESEEAEMYNNHPKIGARLLGNIPRLNDVAYIIENQLKNFNEFATDDVANEENNLGAQIIKAAFDYDLLLFKGVKHTDALQNLAKRPEEYNPVIIGHLSKTKLTTEMTQASLKIADIMIGMVVEESIMSKNNTLLVPKGQEITRTVLEGLHNFSRQIGVKEPIRVQVKKA